METSQFMKLALDEARLAAAQGEVPVGAVLVRDNQVVCSTHNHREHRNDPTAHAEILCLRQGASALGQWRLNECTLYVTLEPCPMCAGAILMSRVKQVVFGADDPEQGCCGSIYDLPADPILHGSTTWYAGDGRAESIHLLQDFFKHKR